MKSILFSLAILFSLYAGAADIKIRINQCGYYPEASKIAIIVEAEEYSNFDLINESGKTVFTGKLGDSISWEKSGERAKKADFTSFTEEGRYQLKVGKSLSYPFEIKKDALCPRSNVSTA